MGLTDYERRQDGKLVETRCLYATCRHLGERLQATETRKTTCDGCWTPIYRCQLHELCTPLGPSVDADVIRWCGGCRDYAKPAPEHFETPADSG